MTHIQFTDKDGDVHCWPSSCVGLDSDVDDKALHVICWAATDYWEFQVSKEEFDRLFQQLMKG